MINSKKPYQGKGRVQLKILVVLTTIGRLLIDGGACRTAPATPGLLNKHFVIVHIFWITFVMPFRYDSTYFTIWLLKKMMKFVMSFQTPPHIQPFSTHFTLLLLKKKLQYL